MTDQPVVVERDNGSGAIVALVTLIGLALLGYLVYQYYGGQTDPTPTQTESTNIDLEVPSPTTPVTPTEPTQVEQTETQ